MVSYTAELVEEIEKDLQLIHNNGGSFDNIDMKTQVLQKSASYIATFQVFTNISKKNHLDEVNQPPDLTFSLKYNFVLTI